jgi:hypothetical protein
VLRRGALKRRTGLRRTTRLKPRRSRTRRRPEGYLDKPHKEAVRAIGICYAQVWIPKRWIDLRAIADPERRADALAEFTETVARYERCGGRLDPDHMADWDRGLGQKPPDSSCAPMCRIHHCHREDGNGLFRRLTREERRAVAEDAIAWTLGQLAGTR